MEELLVESFSTPFQVAAPQCLLLVRALRTIYQYLRSVSLLLMHVCRNVDIFNKYSILLADIFVINKEIKYISKHVRGNLKNVKKKN